MISTQSKAATYEARRSPREITIGPPYIPLFGSEPWKVNYSGHLGHAHLFSLRRTEDRGNLEYEPWVSTLSGMRRQQLKRSQSSCSLPSRVTCGPVRGAWTLTIVFLRESGKIKEVRPGRQRSETHTGDIHQTLLLYEELKMTKLPLT